MQPLPAPSRARSPHSPLLPLWPCVFVCVGARVREGDHAYVCVRARLNACVCLCLVACACATVQREDCADVRSYPLAERHDLSGTRLSRGDNDPIQIRSPACSVAGEDDARRNQRRPIVRSAASNSVTQRAIAAAGGRKWAGVSTPSTVARRSGRPPDAHARRRVCACERRAGFGPAGLCCALRAACGLLHVACCLLRAVCCRLRVPDTPGWTGSRWTSRGCSSRPSTTGPSSATLRCTSSTCTHARTCCR